MTELTLGILCGLGSAVTWAMISILAQALSGRFTPAGINALRSTLAGIMVLLVALAAGYGEEMVRIPLWAAVSLWLSTVIGYAGGDTVFFLGMQELGVTRAHTLSMIHPLLSTIAGVMLFGEPLSVSRAGGILLVLGGLLLIITTKSEGAAAASGARRRGIHLVLVAAVSWSLGALLLKSPLQTVSVMAATGIRGPVGGLILWLTPWARGTWRTALGSRGGEMIRLAGICLLSAASSLLFTVGVKYGGVAIVTVLSTTSPLFTIPLEIVVLRRRPSRRTIAGAAVSVLGIILMS